MNTPKLLKRILKGTFVTLAVLIVAMIAIPYLFRDQIVEVLKEQINASVSRAEVDFSDVSLSLFRSFPDFHLGIQDLSVTGLDQFEGIELFAAREIGVSLDLLSVISSSQPYTISGIHLISPSVNVLIAADGIANYDIMEVEETAEESETQDSEAATEWAADIRSYSIKDAQIVYKDKPGGILLAISDLNHTGSAQLSTDIYTLGTKTTIGSLTAEYGGISWLSDADVDLDAGIRADMAQMAFSLIDNSLVMNALKLNAEGSMTALDEDWNEISLDLSLNAPGNDFKDLLSLIPGAFIEGYEDVSASGQFDFAASFAGTYNALTGQLPATQLMLKVDNGAFKYPDLPVSVDQIQVDARVSAPDGNPDNVVTDVRQFSLALDGQPVSASFRLTTPMSDPNLKGSLEGELDLAKLARAFPMEGVQQMDGLLTANLLADARLSDFDKQDFDRIVLDGTLNANQINYQQTAMPRISVSEASMSFSPQFVDIPTFRAALGNTDLQASGRIDNILAWLTPDRTMTGRFQAFTPRLDVGEWMPAEDETPAKDIEASDSFSTDPDSLFNRFAFSCDLRADTIVYEHYDIRNAAIRGSLSPELLALDNGTILVEGSDFQAAGRLSNWWAYLFEQGNLEGRLDLTSKVIDLNPFMTEDPAEATGQAPAEESTLSPILIPSNLDLAMSANVGKLRYTDLTLKSVTGQLVVADSEVRITEARAQALGGTMGIEGGYNTAEPDHPKFDFRYELMNLDFGQTFSAVNTFEKLAPIGKALTGTFTSTMAMSGELGDDFMPDFSTLDMAGFLQTLDAVLENFGPLNAVSDKLQLDIGRELQIQDTKNWFEVSDGTLSVEPFDLEIKDIAMTVSGSHSIAGEGMDYTILANVPRSRIKRNEAGQLALSGLDFASEQASRLGIDLGSADVFNFEIGLTGSLKAPKVTVKLLGTSGDGSVGDALKEQAGEALEGLKEKALEKVDTAKQQLEAKAKQEIDTLKAKASARVDSLREKMKTEAEGKLDTLKAKAEETLKKELGDKAKGELDSLLKSKKESVEEKLKKWNPLKKKKD